MNSFTLKISLLLVSLMVALPQAVLAQAEAGQTSRQRSQLEWPGKQSDWNGFERFDFHVNGRAAYVVKPNEAAPGNPWVWRARFPNFHAAADLILLDRGFHIARINTDGMLGSPSAMKHWDEFYRFLVAKGFAKKVALEGVSRGGLFVYNFASRWHERVACIYCDTPVCDIKSWPAGKGTGIGHEATWTQCLRAYELTEETSAEFNGSPIDILEPIAKARIPILHIVSLDDKVVPPTENTFVLANRYRKLGGAIDVMEVINGTEKSNGHHFTHPDPVRVADFLECHGSTLPTGKNYFELRGSLNNCRIKFEREKVGRVAFMGGSITEMDGWRDLVKAYLIQRFPNTKFEFIDAGISSTGSTPGAFRLQRDVLSEAPVDLFFEEAAVNDLHNRRSPIEITRGIEGIVRHARIANPRMDMVLMHFVDPAHMKDYRAKKVPLVIQLQEAVAKHYQVPTIHLAHEVTERIDAGHFDWKNDFVNLHPSPYGHRLYASTIRRTLSAAWEKPLAHDSVTELHTLPEPMDRFNYGGGRIVPLESAKIESGFQIDPVCDPRDDGVGGSVRPRFFDVPMLVGTKPNQAFSFEFKGTAVGLFLVAGPDAGTIEYSVDDGDWESVDLFTKWSKGLHLPWVHVLEAELDVGVHELKVRIATDRNSASEGTACRIVNLLVNEITE